MKAQITYDNCFTPYLNNFTQITLDTHHHNKLKNSILKLMNADQVALNRKLNQTEIDKYKKLYMQVAGEVVLEQYLEIDFIDYDNVKNIKKPYVNTIIKNGNVDVCTFSYGYFPLVYAKTYRNTIFICMVSKTEFYICGLGKPNVINGYSSNNLVLNDRLKENGKSGFYAFYHLDPIPSHLWSFITLMKK